MNKAKERKRKGTTRREKVRETNTMANGKTNRHTEARCFGKERDGVKKYKREYKKSLE